MSILSNGNTPINAAESMQAALAALFQQGDVIEIRALGVPMGRMKGTTAGYFDNSHDAVRAVWELSNRGAEGIYVCVNPVKPGCLARAENKLKDGLKPTTGDKDIDHRRWLFIDLDPDRPSGICATDAEKESAKAVALSVWNWLTTELGWPHPLLFDSGNGFHLLARIDLPNTTGTDELVKAILIAIQTRFANDHVKIDQSVGNAARIIRLSGTWNRKGDNTGDRPHRLAKAIHVPSTISTVSLDQLQAVANLAPKSAAGSVGNGQSRLDVPAWLTDRGVQFADGTLPDGRDAWRIICPFDSSHGQRGETIITQEPSGKLGAKCHHDSCSGHA